MSADKTLSWSYTEDFTAEDEATAQARIRGLELGITPVSSGTGAALRMLRPGGVLAVTRALWNDHVADPARRDVTTVAARELGKALRASRALLTTLLPVGDGLLVSVRQT